MKRELFAILLLSFFSLRYPLPPNWFYIFRYRLTKVVLEKRPLNGRYHSDKHFSEFFPTRWRQKSTGIDVEQNCVTATLCIWRILCMAVCNKPPPCLALLGLPIVFWAGQRRGKNRHTIESCTPSTDSARLEFDFDQPNPQTILCPCFKNVHVVFLNNLVENQPIWRIPKKFHSYVFLNLKNVTTVSSPGGSNGHAPMGV